MYSRLLNKLKEHIKTIGRESIAALKRIRYFVIVIVLLAIAVFAIPEILFLPFLDRDEFSRKISKAAAESHITLAWDGITASPWRGIILYNARISMESDPLKIKTAVTIPELKFTPDYLELIKTKTMVIRSVQIDSAKWKYYVNSDEFNENMNDEITALLRKKRDFNITLENIDVLLIFEKKSYEREIWNINLKSGIIRSKSGKVVVDVKYNDAPWGSGQFKFIPELCVKCRLSYGSYIAQIDDLPVNRLSWLFKGYNLNKGFIGARLVADYKKIEKINDIQANLSLNVKGLTINDDTNRPVINNDLISLDMKYVTGKDGLQTDFNGNWDDAKITGKINQKAGSIWPEVFMMQLKNRGSNVLPLIFGYSIKGLSEVSLIVNQDPSGKNYRLISANMFVNSGKILDEKKVEILKIPEVNLQINRNDFQGKLAFGRGDSDINFDIKGSFEASSRRISTLKENEDYKKNTPLEYDAVVFQFEEKGKLESENFYWSDLEPFYTYIKDRWDQNISKDQFQGWRPSILRDRAWFQKYVMRASLQNEILLKKWSPDRNPESGKESFVPVTGFINYANAFLDVSLQSDSQKYQIQLDANSSYPLVRGSYKFDFSSLSGFSKIWLPPDFADNFSGYSVECEFSSSGERPVDLLNNYLGNATFTFRDVSMNKKTGNSDIWETLSASGKKYGSKVMLNLEGQNSKSTITSWGSYNENDDAKWNLKSTVYEKRSSLNF